MTVDENTDFSRTNRESKGCIYLCELGTNKSSKSDLWPFGLSQIGLGVC
jgi:hypothetical protein